MVKTPSPRPVSWTMPLFKRLAGPRELSKAIGNYAKFVGSDRIYGDLPPRIKDLVAEIGDKLTADQV